MAEDEGTGVGSALPFERFVTEVAGGLLRLAMVVAADPATAQDVVQSVLERAFRDWSRIGALDNPHAYVRRMVTNEAISARRRTARHVLTDVLREPPVVSEDDITRLGEVDGVISMLRRLPPRQRAAIALRYLYDMSDAEIARHLQCREVSVRGYVLRGLRTLRVELAADAPSEDLAPPMVGPRLETS